MAAEVESLAYRGLPPWHGVGFKVQDTMHPQEMLIAANLNWTVSKRPLFTTDSTDNQVAKALKFDKMYALVRDQDNEIFGVCGPEYTPFQNSETFEFFQRFCEAGHMTIEVAGSLKKGKWVFALAKLANGTFTLLGDDENYSYLLLCSPHIWSEALTIMFTCVRVVCWNTLTQAMGKTVQSKFRFRHRHNFAAIRETAEISVEQAMIQKTVFEQKARLLASVKIVDVTKLYNYAAMVFQGHDYCKDGNIDPNQLSRNSEQIIQNYYMSPGSKVLAAKETWWGAFNAVTYFCDHQRGKDTSRRLYDAWLEHSRVAVKRKALEMAEQFALAA